jgi:hypothetical protein
MLGIKNEIFLSDKIIKNKKNEKNILNNADIIKILFLIKVRK